MNKAIKDLLFIIVVWSLILILYLFVHNYIHGSIHSSLSCPEGSYSAGDFCKAEPVCEHGDSLDEETCKKFDNPEVERIEPLSVEKYEQFIGK